MLNTIKHSQNIVKVKTIKKLFRDGKLIQTGVICMTFGILLDLDSDGVRASQGAGGVCRS